MVDAYGQKTEAVFLQEPAVLSSCLRAIRCLRGFLALLTASGNGKWQHGGSGLAERLKRCW